MEHLRPDPGGIRGGIKKSSGSVLRPGEGRRIIREESGKGGGNETIKIPVILDGRQVFEAVINRGKRAQSANGRNPFELA